MRKPIIDLASPVTVLVAQVALLVAFFVLWWVLVALKVLPVFFFGDPISVLQRIWVWFATGSIWIHLANTLVETLLSFAIGTVLGLVFGLWLAPTPVLARVLHPFLKAAQSRPPLIVPPLLAPGFRL